MSKSKNGSKTCVEKFRSLIQPQRALAAFFAMALRFLGERFLALARPPFDPPRKPAATFAGSLPFSRASSGSCLAMI